MLVFASPLLAVVRHAAAALRLGPLPLPRCRATIGEIARAYSGRASIMERLRHGTYRGGSADDACKHASRGLAGRLVEDC